MTSRHPLRLAPMPSDEWTDEVRSSLTSLLPAERANRADAGNVLSTLVRHTDLTRAYLPFNTYLLRDSTLSPRIREVALMRVVHRRGCDYLWSHHIPLAHRAGLTDADIDGIRDGAPADGCDRLVVAAVDDLDTQGTISAEVWDQLGKHFDDKQRMDLVFTIGGYALLAMAVNTFGVEDE
ncbi:carboxymuconolactone decarboxylase family protein [Aldersonia sp. NBC_00410]|uniref:carboxymuconolactone decarboxylase family protein n=1 Tax=Aldersonia sp. NBC_00410 TaxID=2975954 RepID=UPI0022556C57|nr:carboxymuconolactone decarboxylase family protein [Aldersonia sp. NBC_00410]MCX5044744.1 carboxymuconolactone decarboxylase family protein [Aldersonia sp. NBC_00410]